MKLAEVPAILSRATSAGSVVVSGLGLGLIVFGEGVNQFFHAAPGVNPTISSMVLLPMLFLFVFTPKYAVSGFWALGLFLGVDETTFQVQRFIQAPADEVGSFSLFGWPVYMAFIVAFLAVSVYMLRKQFRWGPLGLGLLFGAGFGLAVLANVYTVFAGIGAYVGYDTPRDLLLAFALVSVVKPEKEAPRVAPSR